MHIIRSILLIAILSLTTQLTAADYQIVQDTSDLKILTPSLAERKTEKMILSNGLEVLIISDPGIDKSGAALAVEVGSWQDPPNHPGLAHFLEHMLFLGTETYPEENGFMRYLKAHDGNFNAYTADQRTVYMFSINSDAFNEALDRFAHFFIDPSLTSSGLDREQHAVDQEFARSYENDDWRTEMVLKELGNPNHPNSQFSCGNLQTLNGVTSEDLKQWLEAHYSSNLMRLVIYSPLPLDQLTEMAATDFSALPNRHVGPFAISLPQTSPAMQGKMVYISPVKDLRQLTLLWELPYDPAKATATHAAELVSYILGYEGEHGLLAALKKEGLAENLKAGSSVFNKPYTPTYILYMTIDLTEEGMKKKDTVIGQCFQAIHYFRDNLIPHYIYDEVHTMSLLGYEYQTREDVFSTVSSNAAALLQEGLASYPSHTLLASDFDPNYVRATFEKLTPASCCFVLLANPKETGVKPTNKEKWMEAPYAVQPISSSLLVQWDSTASGPDFAAPAPNPFIPQHLTIAYQGPLSEQLPQPKVLTEDDGQKMYYAQDHQYLTPQVAWTFTIKSPKTIMNNPKAAVLLDLYTRSVNESLNETGYLAKIAGLNYTLNTSLEGIVINISGFSEKAPLLFREILKKMRSGVPTDEQFKIYQASLQQTYLNAAHDLPLMQAHEIILSVIYKDFIPNADKAKAIKSARLSDLKDLFAALPEKTYIEGLLYGNMKEDEALAIAQEIKQEFQRKPYPEGRSLHPQVVSLPTSKGPLFLLQNSKIQGNAVILAIEEGMFSFQHRAAQQILSSAIQEPFFSTLRTKQQTGYAVRSWDKDLERHLFQFFGVQSNTHDGRDLLARFELLCEDFLRDLQETYLPESNFNVVKEALMTSLKQPPKNMDEMCALLDKLAFECDGDFDWINKRLDGFASLTYKQFIELAQAFLGKENKQRLAVILKGKIPPENSLQYERVPSQKRMRAMSTYETRNAASSSSGAK